MRLVLRAYTEPMQPDVRVDASGTYCPAPLLEIAKEAWVAWVRKAGGGA